MSLEIISEWLKGSILGIIVLGAVGSLLAVLLLRILTWLSKKFLKYFMEHFLVNRIKPYVMYKAIFSGYERNKDMTRLVLLSIMVAGGFFTSTVLLFMVLVLSGFYFYYYHITISVTTFLVIFAIVFFGNFWLKDAFSFAAMYKVFFEKHFNDIKEIFKDKDIVISQFLKGEDKTIQEEVTKAGEEK